MQFDTFTVVTGLLLGTFLTLTLHFLGRRDFFLRAFGVRTMLFLYLLCVLRTILPVKFPFTIPVGASVWDRLSVVLSTPLSDTRWNVRQLLMAVWLAGTAVSLLRFAVREIRLARRLREYPGARNPLAETVMDNIWQTAPRRLPVRVRVYKRLNMPIGVGLFHPLICLPDRDYTAKELDYILRHEYTHFLGRDLYIKFLTRVYAGVFWWNPAAWLLLEDIGQMLELRCDRAVTKDFTLAERREYLTVILRSILESEKAPDIFPMSISLGSSRNRGGMLERFWLVADPEKIPDQRCAVILAGSVLLFAVSYAVLFQPAAAASFILPDGIAETLFLLVVGGGAAAWVWQRFYPINSAIRALYSSDMLKEVGDSMLLPWEIKCNMTRAPIRSILIACVSALIVCGMALYLRNIQVTEDVLNDLGQRYPVTVRVTNRDGSLHKGLRILEKDVDYLLESGVRDPVYIANTFRAEGVGNIHGTNTLDSLEDLTEGDFTFLDGWDGSFPDSREPVIALREDVALENGWQLGDKLYLEFSMLDRVVAELERAGGYSVTLVAFFSRDLNTARAVMPVDWLRGIADADLPEGAFKYDSFYAVIDEPRELNDYKDAAEKWGFYERSAVADPDLWGDTLSIEDEMYIKIAGEIMEILNLYHAFLSPFFVLVTLIMAMVTFLALRSRRRQIAIASSLGRQKFRNAAAHFCSTVIVQLLGGLLAVSALHWTVNLMPWLAVMTLGAFSLCAAGGTVAALMFLFHFDTLTLLTRND